MMKITAVFKSTKIINIVQCDKLRSTKQKEEDLKFLDALKDGKKLVLGSVDKEYTRKLQSYKKRKQSSEKYVKNHCLWLLNFVLCTGTGK